MKELKRFADQNWSVNMANSIIEKYPYLTDKWQYDYGVVFKGMEYVYKKTNDKKYFNYIKENIDYFVEEDGNIKKYNLTEYNIDHINNGKSLFFLYKETKQEKYKKAIELLRNQLKTHPRTTEGGFWHKNIYPHQMWLDGIYMASPFLAEYAHEFGEADLFDDVAKQIILCAKHTKDPITGLHYHGWDESRNQKWSNKITGCSPNFWGRAMGWYAMAIVDILDYLPENHESRESIIGIFESMIEALIKYQDKETGLWYQVVNRPDIEKNYHEASASCMFSYAIAKAINNDYISHKYLDNLEMAYKGIINNFVKMDNNGYYELHGTCMVAGLGGNPYRDGSVEYYLSEPIKVDDFKGVGAFIKASAEIEKLFN